MASSIGGVFNNLSVCKLMVQIWEYSYHVHPYPPSKRSSCSCCSYLDCCIEAARNIWSDEFIFFNTAIYKFQFQRASLQDIMSIKEEFIRNSCIELVLKYVSL